MIKCIIFDGHGTLFSSTNAAERIKSVLHEEGHDIEMEEIQKATTTSKRISSILVSKGLIKLNGQGYLVEGEIRMMLLGFEDDEARRLAKVISDKWTEAGKRKPYPESETVLKSLKERGFTIGFLTAGAILSYSETFKSTGFGKYFSFLVGEDTVNAPKPDPVAYSHAIKMAGCKPEEILFVGDNIANDYEGPKLAGMKALLVDREGNANGDFVKVKDLRPLLEKDFLVRFELGNSAQIRSSKKSTLKRS